MFSHGNIPPFELKHRLAFTLKTGHCFKQSCTWMIFKPPEIWLLLTLSMIVSHLEKRSSHVLQLVQISGPSKKKIKLRKQIFGKLFTHVYKTAVLVRGRQQMVLKNRVKREERDRKWSLNKYCIMLEISPRQCPHYPWSSTKDLCVKLDSKSSLFANMKNTSMTVSLI